MKTENTVQLKKNFDKKDFDTGASILKIALWYYTSLIFFRSGILTSSTILVFILRLFGAKIGRQVRIKPCINIKYPWKLHVGNYCWLADCSIDNLDYVMIGDHVCISQKATLITGNHDYISKTFDLFTAPIILKDGVWIGANSTVSPGVIAESHAVLCMGSAQYGNMDNFTIYRGNPAVAVKLRKIQKID